MFHSFNNLVRHLLGKKIFREFILYVIIGGFAIILDFSLVFFLTSIAGVYYIYSATISYPIATIIHFLLNKYLNFRNKNKKVFRQMFIFLGINLVSWGLTVLIMYLLVEYFSIWYLIAKAIAIMVVVFYSFTMHKLITFRH